MAHLLDKVFGDPNARTLKRYRKVADAALAHEQAWQGKTDAELFGATSAFRARMGAGEKLEALLPEVFAAVREAAHRTLKQKHYPSQMVGAMALVDGAIAEMRTGEGKTLTATLAAYAHALAGKGVHVVTVNDYLAKRDTAWMGQIYHALGMTVGCIQHEGGYRFDPSAASEQAMEQEDATGAFRVERSMLRAVSRADAYGADITYGTNNEFGFDYLRDNMVSAREQMVQRELAYAIVDEADSILIDEARTPLIISGPAAASSALYAQCANIAKQLVADADYNLDEKLRAATFTQDGISKVEKLLGVENLYAEGGVGLVHHLEQALRAQTLYAIDKEYVVRDGEIIIVDEFTGRLMEGRRFSEGLHQAIEAKEGVKVREENQTLGTITFQNYFRLYGKLAGMTGTAKTEEEEFEAVYNLTVVTVPPNKPPAREDKNDQVYKTHRAKLEAVVREVGEAHRRGQPVLVGTISIERNQELSSLLSAAGIPHQVLNAKQHEREGEIIAQAGRKGAVTVATNMAGRGVDILLGGNPSTKEEQEEVRALGGLFVIGTERHEARRIDNQLRGRAGRQGDAGLTMFFVSLEDDLMRIFGGDRLKSMMDRLKVPDDMPIEHGFVSKSIASAQKRVEGFHFDTRKRVLEYDGVLSKQREVFYGMRRAVVETPVQEEPLTMREAILEHFASEIEQTVAMHTAEEGAWQVAEICEVCETFVSLSENTRAICAQLQERQIPPRAGEAAQARTRLIEAVEADVRAAYGALDAKEGADRTMLARVERDVVLRSMDHLWVEHLDAMRKLRSAVGLEGYAQRDPLVAYKRDGYHLFQQMLSEIQKQIVYGFFHWIAGWQAAREAYARAQEPTLAERVGLEGNRSSAVAPSAETETQPTSTATTSVATSSKTPGRNEPCHCGSGKKFKKCHGA